MYERTVLPNGVRIISEYLPHVRSITLGAWFTVGSRHEEPQQRGLAHFIEHMLFQSNEKYSARQIAQIMDQSGSYFNAFTGRERTCFYFKVLDEHWPSASDVLRQMLLHPLLIPQEIAKERSVILEELKMYEDDPEDLVQDLLPGNLWPKSPLGNSILGTAEAVRGFTQTNARAFLREHYTADRLVIAAVGNISHGQIVDEFASAFASLPQKNPLKLTAPGEGPAVQLFHDKDTEQIHLCLGGPAVARTDERRFALYLLDIILGGTASSLLFQELREKRGLVYNTYSFTSLYTDAGYYGIYAGFSPYQWNRVWDVLCELLSDLPGKITEEMFTSAQANLRGSVLLSLESTEARMFRLAKAELDATGYLGTEQFLEKVRAVKYQDLLSLGEKLFAAGKWSSIALGPGESLKGEIRCQKIC